VKVLEGIYNRTALLSTEKCATQAKGLDMSVSAQCVNLVSEQKGNRGGSTTSVGPIWSLHLFLHLHLLVDNTVARLLHKLDPEWNDTIHSVTVGPSRGFTSICPHLSKTTSGVQGTRGSNLLSSPASR
jgi:hypothetical protein